MATQDEIKEFIAEHLIIPPADIVLTKPLDEYVTQLDLINLLHALSEEYGIRFDVEERVQLETMGDLLNLIEDKLLEI